MAIRAGNLKRPSTGGGTTAATFSTTTTGSGDAGTRPGDGVGGDQEAPPFLAELQVGDVVLIHGLQSEAGLWMNGREGLVTDTPGTPSSGESSCASCNEGTARLRVHKLATSRKKLNGHLLTFCRQFCCAGVACDESVRRFKVDLASVDGSLYVGVGPGWCCRPGLVSSACQHGICVRAHVCGYLADRVAPARAVHAGPPDQRRAL